MRTYGKLREKAKNLYGGISAFADALGLDRSTVSKKMNSVTPWTQPEMEAVCNLLNIPYENIPEYFFYEE